MNDVMKITTYTPDYNGSIAIVYTDSKELSQHLNEAQLDRVHALGEKFEEKWLEVQAGTDTAWVYKLGKTTDADARAEKMRQAGNTLVLKANAAYLDRIALLGAHVPHVAEGAILGNYQFLRYFSDSHKRKNSMAQLFVSKEDEQTLAPIAIATMGTLFARELVNTPVIDLTATDLANQAKEASKRHGFSIEVLEKKQIESLKMGGLLAVNYGSPEPPVFIIMEHKPKNAKNEKPLVLVGKGVVYDTGGLSLKPSNFMDDMKSDMGGAAAVIGAMSAAAEADLPVHIIGLVPATDNRPGGNAVTPGDVITISDGTSVEVMNTDAEGRLILSDALVYAKRYQPELVIDLATLTGSCSKSHRSLCDCRNGKCAQRSACLHFKKAATAPTNA
jgi:leucyl aminopeptidase